MGSSDNIAKNIERNNQKLREMRRQMIIRSNQQVANYKFLDDILERRI